MSIPGFTAEAAVYQTVYDFQTAGNFESAAGEAAVAMSGAAVVPQVCVGSPCLTLGGGQFCINLPIVGRRCVNIPSLGSWKIRCCTRWGWPPVSCGVSRC